MRLTQITLETLVIDPELAIGTVEDCLLNPGVTGDLIDYVFFVLNGRRVLLGHYDLPPVDSPMRIGGPNTNYIFITQGDRKRHITNWEDLRVFLAENWIIGTECRPGVKIWFASTGRNSRRSPEKIFVARR
jgi:hypothetical protein